MSKQYLITHGFKVAVPRGPDRREEMVEFKPGMLVDESEVPEGQSGEVWCDDAHQLAREVGTKDEPTT